MYCDEFDCYNCKNWDVKLERCVLSCIRYIEYEKQSVCLDCTNCVDGSILYKVSHDVSFSSLIKSAKFFWLGDMEEW